MNVVDSGLFAVVSRCRNEMYHVPCRSAQCW